MPGAKKDIFNAAKDAAPVKTAQALPIWGIGYSQQKDGMIFVPWDETSENQRKRHLEQSILRHTIVQKPFKVGKPLKFNKR